MYGCDALEWYFRKTEGVCPTCIFPADIQYFSGRKLMEFGLKTLCLGGTLNKRKFSVYSYRLKRRTLFSLFHLFRSMFVLLFRWWDGGMLNWDRMNEQVILGVFLFY